MGRFRPSTLVAQSDTSAYGYAAGDHDASTPAPSRQREGRPLISTPRGMIRRAARFFNRVGSELPELSEMRYFSIRMEVIRGLSANMPLLLSARGS
jgi:hypothetical protein